MNTKQLSEDVSVTGQVQVGDLATVADQGFKAVICNRPDGEGDDQPSFSDIEAEAERLGLQARYIPIVPGIAGAMEAKEMANALVSLPKPILAFCRSGARSETFVNAAASL